MQTCSARVHSFSELCTAFRRRYRESTGVSEYILGNISLRKREKVKVDLLTIVS
jgi:hypothetical protein